MSMLLPPGFEALEPFAGQWAGETAAQRAHLRGVSSAAERNAFHAACAPLLRPGLERLDAVALNMQNAAEKRLMHLFLSFAHVSLAVEVQGDDEERHRPLREAMRITRALADDQ